MATFDALRGVMAAAGKPAEAFTLPDGTRLLLLPYGARRWPVRLRQRRKLLLDEHAAGGSRDGPRVVCPKRLAQHRRRPHLGGAGTGHLLSRGRLEPVLAAAAVGHERLCRRAKRRGSGTVALDELAPGPSELRRQVEAEQVVWPGRQPAPLRARHGGFRRGGPICRLHAAGRAAIARPAGRSAAGRGHLEPGPASAWRRDAGAAV